MKTTDDGDDDAHEVCRSRAEHYYMDIVIMAMAGYKCDALAKVTVEAK